MFKLSLILFAAVAIASAAAKDSPANKVAVSASVKDVDPQGFPYNPIYCHNSHHCRCRESGGGSPQCSRCPDDRGSSHKYNNVCWCKNVFHWHGYGRNECNPLKGGGPQQIGDWDHSGVEYRPLRCLRRNQCACNGIGTPECSRCPDDQGSKNKYNNVCWCRGIYWGQYGRHGNECNQFKHNGPKQLY